MAALLAPSLSAQGNAPWREDVWLADKNINPCNYHHRRCDIFLRRIYDGIIDARQRGDAKAMKKWSMRLDLHYMYNPEDRPISE